MYASVVVVGHVLRKRGKLCLPSGPFPVGFEVGRGEVDEKFPSVRSTKGSEPATAEQQQRPWNWPRNDDEKLYHTNTSSTFPEVFLFVKENTATVCVCGWLRGGG